jgi:hypothetical protein
MTEGGSTCGRRIMVIMVPSQGTDGGSIPLVRSHPSNNERSDKKRLAIFYGFCYLRIDKRLSLNLFSQ